MPVYLYQHPSTGEVKEVVQSMSQEHSYSENELKWNRVFTVPNSAIDTIIDASKPSDFLRATQKKMTLGDMWDESGRLSEKRVQKLGYDPVKEKAIAKYEKRCRKRHPLKDPNPTSITHILE
jgi:hypothetical protein